MPDPLSIATLVIAAVTLIVAGATLRVADETKRVAEETRGVATATHELGVATGELAGHTQELAAQAALQVAGMQTAHRLEVAPYLTFQPEPGDQVAGGWVHYTARITNVGRGPGINCILVRFLQGQQWSVSANFELGPGQSFVTTANAQQDGPPDFVTGQGAGRSLLFCLDQFGGAWLFDPPRPVKTWSQGGEVEEWLGWYQAQIAPGV